MGRDLLAGPATEVSLTVTRAEPNARPKGLKPGEGGSIDSVKTFSPGQHVDPGTYDDATLGQTTRWVEPVRVQRQSMGGYLLLATPEVSTPCSRCVSSDHPGGARKESALDGLVITVIYEVYRGEPVVRKWVEIANEGSVWRKIEQLTIDDFASRSEPFRASAADSGRLWGSDEHGRLHLVRRHFWRDCRPAKSPRDCGLSPTTGRSGYHPAMFEWVLGPGETICLGAGVPLRLQRPGRADDLRPLDAPGPDRRRSLPALPVAAPRHRGRAAAVRCAAVAHLGQLRSQSQ